MKRPNPGGDFEAAILRSLPDRADVWRRKSPTPPRPAPVAELCGEIERRCAASRMLALRIERLLTDEARKAMAENPLAEPPDWARRLAEASSSIGVDGELPPWVASARALGSQFTPSAGVDLSFSAPADASWRNTVPAAVAFERRPLVVFAIECKSVAEPRIPFDRLRTTQEKELMRCAAGGHVGGLLIEWRTGPSCWFVPIGEWIKVREGCGRKSLTLEHCITVGVEVERDASRGRVRNYWKMGEFIRRFGGEV